MTPIDRLTRLAWRVRAALGSRALQLQAMRFAAVGVVNTTVDVGVFLLAFTYVTSSLIGANICSWLVAVTGSYVMNSYITFAAESGRQLRLRSYVTFLASAVFALIANTAALLFAVHVLLVPVAVGKVLAVGVSFVVNFSLARFVVFRPQQPQAGEAV